MTANRHTDTIQRAKEAILDTPLLEEAMGGGGGEEAAAVLRRKMKEQGERVKEMKKSGADNMRREGRCEGECEGTGGSSPSFLASLL